jgi:hypothetical protein
MSFIKSFLKLHPTTYTSQSIGCLGVSCSGIKIASCSNHNFKNI